MHPRRSLKLLQVVSCLLKHLTDTAGGSCLWHTLAMNTDESKNKADPEEPSADDNAPEEKSRPKEIGGRGGLDPTRYGDWEKSGRCIDF